MTSTSAQTDTAARAVDHVVFFGFSGIVANTLLRTEKRPSRITVVADPKQSSRDLPDGSRFSDVTALAGVHGIIADDPREAAVLEAVAGPSTVAVSVGAPWFFDEEYIEGPLGGRGLNLHGTRLPKDRGAAIFSWTILRGQRTGLCLLHRLAARLDGGTVIRFQEFLYPASCRTPGQHMAVYDDRNADFLVSFLAEIAETGLPLGADGVVPDYLSSYWPRLDARLNGWLDWDLPLVDAERFVCAFDEPYGGARTYFGDTAVVLRGAWAQSVDGHTHPYQRGIVFRKNADWITVAANGGELLIEHVTDLDGNDVASQIKVGDRLHTPRARLEEALMRPTRAQQVGGTS